MAKEELQTYIKATRAKGSTDVQIRQALAHAGWDHKDIDAAFFKDTLPLPPTPPGKEAGSATSSTSMWDAFEHILMFISLYVMATAIALLLHYYVDRWSPGVDYYSGYSYSYSYSQDDSFSPLIRGYFSALIVSFPLFAFFFSQIEKRTKMNPMIRKLRARKILIYLTLIGTFIIMLCGVIATVYSLLSGNVTMNFIFHLVVTLGVAGTIFLYYLNQVKADRVNE